MAYSPGDWLVVVRGNIAGGEVWANTWAVELLDASDVQPAADAFHDFYEALAPLCNDTWDATSVVFRDLDTQEAVAPSWTTITGGDAVNPALPTEVALRVSLSGAGGVRGGPFLAGFGFANLSQDGRMIDGSRDVIVSGVEALNLALGISHLAIHRPTLDVLVTADQVRVGRTFDVIRRRRSAISEDFQGASLP